VLRNQDLNKTHNQREINEYNCDLPKNKSLEHSPMQSRAHVIGIGIPFGA